MAFKDYFSKQNIIFLCIVVFFYFFYKIVFSSFTNISSGKVYIFHAPWCGHCRAAMPEFEKVVEQNPDIELINSEYPESKILIDKFEVRGFPTILKDNGTKYIGPRTAESILEFAQN